MKFPTRKGNDDEYRLVKVSPTKDFLLLVKKKALSEDGALQMYRASFVTNDVVEGKLVSKTFNVAVPGYLGNKRNPNHIFKAEEVWKLTQEGLLEFTNSLGKPRCLAFNDFSILRKQITSGGETIRFYAHEPLELTVSYAKSSAGVDLASYINLTFHEHRTSLVIHNCNRGYRNPGDGKVYVPAVMPNQLRGLASFISRAIAAGGRGETLVESIPCTANQQATLGIDAWLISIDPAELAAACAEIAQFRAERDNLYAIALQSCNWDAFNAFKKLRKDIEIPVSIVPSLKEGEDFLPLDEEWLADFAEGAIQAPVIFDSVAQPGTEFASIGRARAPQATHTPPVTAAPQCA